MRKMFAVHNRRDVEFVDGKLKTIINPTSVRVLSFAEGYAMVKRKDTPNAMPYIASLSEIASPNIL